jgi:hypothetical protein
VDAVQEGVREPLLLTFDDAGDVVVQSRSGLDLQNRLCEL